MSASRNNLEAALAAHRGGNFSAAERIYRALLRAQPANPDVLYLLAMLCLDTDRPGPATGLFRRALAAAHNVGRSVDTAWLLALGTAQQRDDDHAGALETFDQALKGDPQSVDAMFCRATALQSLERNEAAIEAYAALLDREPRHAQAAYNFGLLLRDAGKPDGAAQALRKAVLLKPDYGEAHAALAPLLEDLGWHEDAIDVYRRAVELNPGDTDLVARYSRCLMVANMVEAAEGVLQPALDAYPDSPKLLAQYAALRMFRNDRTTAIRISRRVLSESDEVPAIHATLAEAEPDGDHEAAIAEIGAILKAGAPDKKTEAALEFAWARRLEYLKRYEEAFDHYVRANTVARKNLEDRGIGYDRDAEERMDSLFTEVCAGGALFGLSGNDSELPLFVVGMPRSGTTLTEQILASHPQIAGAGELIAIPNAAKRLGQALRYPHEPPTETALRKIAERYLERLRQVDATALRVVDKLPGNYRHLGLIAMLFPNARVVHCRRDPVDTCLSCYFQNFVASGLAWSFDLGHLVDQYRRYRRLMAHWRSVVPLRMLELDYEETVADLESQARRLIAFAGLEWDDACLAFHESNRSVITASHRQVRQPIYRSSVGRWKRYGPGVAPLVEGLSGLCQAAVAPDSRPAAASSDRKGS